jgi:hypothetical protein
MENKTIRTQNNTQKRNNMLRIQNSKQKRKENSPEEGTEAEQPTSANLEPPPFTKTPRSERR